MSFFEQIITNDYYRKSAIMLFAMLILSIILLIIFVHSMLKIKVFSKFRLVKSLALISPIIASVVSIVSIFFITIFVYISNGDNKNSDASNVIGEINIVITLLSIAIAVWIGLNIYNAVEKRQIDLLSERTESIKQSTENCEKASAIINTSLNNIKEQVEKDTIHLTHTQKERVRSSINLLINILINTQQDIMTGYFIKKFYSLLNTENELTKISEFEISKLICIETYFVLEKQSFTFILVWLKTQMLLLIFLKMQ